MNPKFFLGCWVYSMGIGMFAGFVFGSGFFMARIGWQLAGLLFNR